MAHVALLLLAGAAATFAAPATAQMTLDDDEPLREDDAIRFVTDRNVSVQDRARLAHQPSGIRAGSVLLLPRVTLRTEYSDNVRAVSSGRRDDLAVKLQPEISLRSDWARHRLSLFATASINRFASVQTENVEDYLAGGNARLDFGRDLDIRVGGEAGRLTEPRTSSNNIVETRRPIRYARESLYLDARKTFNRLRISARLDYANLDYDDGVLASDPSVKFDQDDRDRRVLAPSLRLEYAFSPDSAVFTQVTYNKRDYALRTLLDRNSKGYDVVGGVRFDLTKLIRGEVAVGYTKQDYHRPLVDVQGLSVAARVEWFPTELMTVAFTGSRGIDESASIVSGGYFFTRAGVRIDYELLRNLLINANVEAGNNDFRGVDREDKRFAAGIGARYYLNRNYVLGTGYAYLRQRSEGVAAGKDFGVSTAYLSLTVQGS